MRHSPLVAPTFRGLAGRPRSPVLWHLSHLQDENTLLILSEPNQNVYLSARNVEKLAINTGAPQGVHAWGLAAGG